jgi:formate dehydrogenase subunit delta
VAEHGLDRDLVRMANQISRQFGYLSDEEAAAKVAYHLHAFWEPRMIAGLEAHAAAQPGDFDPIVLAATRILVEQYGETAAAH